MHVDRRFGLDLDTRLNIRAGVTVTSSSATQTHIALYWRAVCWATSAHGSRVQLAPGTILPIACTRSMDELSREIL